MGNTIGKQLRDQARGATDDTSISVSDDDATVSVDVEHAERYAVGVRGLRIEPAHPVRDVGEAADRIARQVDAVDELRVVEYDQSEQQAILRSAQPQSDEEGVDYWEATVKPTETTLQHYHKAHSEPERAAVVEPLSYGTLGQLADQIVDAVAHDKGAATDA
ncbi:MAG: hypothetical protein AVDCRST_MAG93-2009 [uncultured Chloroflexia bacterium]|uniref:Uncharacterized protein n=1 Tax=uncultured Chloroflexia bacterium TaxID=1672391 RepID=A0A6J4INW7_9CHLR|nr:MAG: hypothetical protein AVDCRST_MAG93-2009 [uncultured Chloroflexia bacterium]